MISAVKSPRPPFSKGGRPLWLAISSSFPLLQRGMEGDFHARGRQHFSVMNVYEGIKNHRDERRALSQTEWVKKPRAPRTGLLLKKKPFLAIHPRSSERGILAFSRK